MAKKILYIPDVLQFSDFDCDVFCDNNNLRDKPINLLNFIPF